MQNTSKWKGKLFCLFFSLIKNVGLHLFLRRVAHFMCFSFLRHCEGRRMGEWLRVGAGTLLLMFPGLGHGVSVCTHKPGLAAKEHAETKSRACCGSPQENG